MTDHSEPPTLQIVTCIIIALSVIFFLGVGCGQEWGAAQWGPVAAWLSGALTLAAVVVALREAARSQWAREIDHEISRRRECIAALGKLWGAIVGLTVDFRILADYLDDLDPTFNITEQRTPAPLRGPQLTYGDEILARVHAFFDKWTSTVEPQLFTAPLVLRGTSLYGPVLQVNEDANTIKTAGIRSITRPIMNGQRPDTEPLTNMWHELQRKRDDHAKLAHKHFSLDRHDVDRYLRQTRRRACCA